MPGFCLRQSRLCKKQLKEIEFVRSRVLYDSRRSIDWRLIRKIHDQFLLILKLSILLIETDPNLPVLFWIASVDDSTLAGVLRDSSQSRTRHGDLAKPASDAPGTPKRATLHNVHHVNPLLPAIPSLGSDVKNRQIKHFWFS